MLMLVANGELGALPVAERPPEEEVRRLGLPRIEREELEGRDGRVEVLVEPGRERPACSFCSVGRGC